MGTSFYSLRALFVCVAFLPLLHSCGDVDVKIGDPLPAWKEGSLDIHFINTGRGECTYQIFPDGTTFLTDASGPLLNTIGVEHGWTPPKPSPDITAGKVIVDYITHFAPPGSEGHIDYFLLTHHHGDHCGCVDSALPFHDSGLFRLTSLTEIGSTLVLDRLMDRDYPDFTYPTPAAQDTILINNYKAFLGWTKEVNGSRVEKWKVGSSAQVVPLYDPNWGVSLRSYSGNGCFWTGGGEEETYTLMPTVEEFEAGAALPNENCFSCSYILSYGDFDFFLGGDLQHNDRDAYPYMDVETPVAKVVHKVEVMKANHHGCYETHDPFLMSVLCPDVWLAGVWCNNQVVAPTVDNILEANPDCEIFSTNVNKDIAGLGEERLKNVASQYGHVVIRVSKGGKSFMVYTLEDSDQEYRVKSVHGPYICK